MGSRPGDYNPSLPSIAAGAELKLLLDRLPYYQAVYVFGAESASLAAVLRVSDLSSAIAAGRCVFVPPGHEEAVLREHLAAHPGLLHPGNIVVLPGVADERIRELCRTCERVARDVLQARVARLNELRKAAAATTADEAGQRLAVIALTPEAASRVASEAITGAARALGWPAACCRIGGPEDMHVLPHCEKLAALSPNLTICVNHPPERVPLRLRGAVCEWVTSAARVPATLPADGKLWLAASPHVAAALRSAAGDGANVREWYWGCESGSDDAIEAKPEDYVLLVADWPTDDPDACGIEQPSHQQLWQHLRQMAAKCWDGREILQPAGLLARAEQATGVHLGEASLRPWLLLLIEDALIPAAITGTIVRALASEPIRVKAVGRGWSERPGKEIEVLAEHLFELPDHGASLRPRAAIFAGSIDPLSPALLHAGVLGWPLLVHSPGAQRLGAALGQILHPEQHLLPFAGRTELRAALGATIQDRQQACRRAARTRQHLRENHSYERRLEQLGELVAGMSSA